MKKILLFLVLFSFIGCNNNSDIVVAKLDYTPTNPKLNESVICNNKSINAINYSWFVEFSPMLFNPSNPPKTIKSEEKHIKFTCYEVGTYTIKLQVWDSEYNTDSYVSEFTVR